MATQITEQTRLLAHFHAPSERSFLPTVYNEAFDQIGFDGRCMAFELTANLVEKSMEAMRTLYMIGAHVSSAFATAVLIYLDETDQSARLHGAANVIANHNGKLTGYYLPGKSSDEITIQSDASLSQCAAAFRLWTGQDMPLDYIKLWLSVLQKQQPN